MLVLDNLIIGISMGSIYALVALGYTMVYGIVRLINFAHGDFIMVGGYTLFLTIPLCISMGLPAFPAVLFAIIVSAVVGVGVELLAYRPIRKKGTGMTALITAIAMSLLLENVAQVIFGADPQSFKWAFFGEFTQLSFGPEGNPVFTVSAVNIITICVSVVLMILLTLFVNKTKMGRAMRAVSEDKIAATVTGVNTNSTILITFAIGAALAAIASLCYCAQTNSVFPDMGATLGLYAFVAAVLGGIGSIPGAVVGGFTIGFVETIVKSNLFGLIPSPGISAYRDAAVYLVLIIVLLIQPTGILGKNVKEKV